jgi:hypothetical protein
MFLEKEILSRIRLMPVQSIISVSEGNPICFFDEYKPYTICTFFRDSTVRCIGENEY